MARKAREDGPGVWHHVVNRGMSKRPLFERREDMRFFLARLARQVREGRIEVHAYCLMTTHYHLLLRSVNGELSEAMRRIQNEYSRRFNRQRERDGSLIRGRFFSRPVNSLRYRRILVRYIDSNPVRAAMTSQVGDYEHCSAHDHRTGRHRPWLCGEWIASVLAEIAHGADATWAEYLRMFGAQDVDAVEESHALVESRILSNARMDPLDDLIGTVPADIRRWMANKARLADGHRIGLPAFGPTTLRRALTAHLESRGEWLLHDRAAYLRGSELAWFGISRDHCGLSLTQLGDLSGMSRSSVDRLCRLHRQRLLSSEEHATRCAEIVSGALERILK